MENMTIGSFMNGQAHFGWLGSTSLQRDKTEIMFLMLLIVPMEPGC